MEGCVGVLHSDVSVGPGTQLTTGPAVFTRSFKRLQGDSMAQHAAAWKGARGVLRPRRYESVVSERGWYTADNRANHLHTIIQATAG